MYQMYAALCVLSSLEGLDCRDDALFDSEPGKGKHRRLHSGDMAIREEGHYLQSSVWHVPCEQQPCNWAVDVLTGICFVSSCAYAS